MKSVRVKRHNIKYAGVLCIIIYSHLCCYFLGSPHIGFANAAYDATGDEEHQSEEELHEIRRVSQVPFHSDTDTYLNKVRLHFSQIYNIVFLHCIIL